MSMQMIATVGVFAVVLGSILAFVVNRDACAIGADGFMWGFLALVLPVAGAGIYFAMRSGMAQVGEHRRNAEAAALQPLIAGLPMGGGIQIPMGEGINFTSLPAAEEAMFFPYEARIKVINRKTAMISSVVAGVLFVFVVVTFIAIPAPKGTAGSMDVTTPAPAATTTP